MNTDEIQNKLSDWRSEAKPVRWSAWLGDVGNGYLTTELFVSLASLLVAFGWMVLTLYDCAVAGRFGYKNQERANQWMQSLRERIGVVEVYSGEASSLRRAGMSGGAQ